MLYVYGALMPLRVLEEIRFWKMQEKEHTVVIRELVPTLEPQFVLLMQQWEGVFAQTEAVSGQLIEAVVRSHPPISPICPHKSNSCSTSPSANRANSSTSCLTS